MKNYLLLFSVLIVLSCSNNTSVKTETADSSTVTAKDSNLSKKTTTPANPSGAIADAATIIARPQVPILCYHHIRLESGKKLNEFEVNVDNFRQQMKALSDSGYHTILPDQLYNYLAYGTPLPEKPVMLTYDDTDEEQFTVAKTEMDKYGFKGVYFIMTISIGRPHYMSKEQIRQLSDEGHVIASHTWRHDRVDKYLTTPHIDRDTKKVVNNDWDLQLVETRKKLEDIIGKEIHYFAFPYGIWKKDGLPEVQKRGFKLAFQLSDKRDPDLPLMTVRRMIVVPGWTAAGVLRVMKSTFK